MCTNLFNGNSCTWILVLVIIFLLLSDNTGCGCNSCNSCNPCNACCN